MTGTAQRVGQAIALLGVVALLGLLVWKVAFDREGGAAAQLGKGQPVAAPAFTLERLDRDGTLAPTRGMFVATKIKPQARVYAESRDIECVEIDLDELRTHDDPKLKLF